MIHDNHRNPDSVGATLRKGDIRSQGPIGGPVHERSVRVQLHHGSIEEVAGVGVPVARLGPRMLLQRLYPRFQHLHLGFKGPCSALRRVLGAASSSDERCNANRGDDATIQVCVVLDGHVRRRFLACPKSAHPPNGWRGVAPASLTSDNGHSSTPGATGRCGAVVVAALTRTRRGISSELVLSAADGVPTDCVVNFDTIHTLPREAFRRRLTRVGPSRIEEACRVLQASTGC